MADVSETPTAGDYLTVGAAADILNLTESRVRQLLREGELQGHHSGRRWSVWRPSVEARKRSDGRSVGAGRPDSQPATLAALLDLIWLPDPDECPIDLTISASGFHAEPAGGRIFRWTWKDRAVSRCWFTEPEERQLQRFLTEQGSESISLMERYVELRTRSAVFLTMAARYRFGLEIGNGIMPLKTIRAAMTGGANLDRRHGDNEEGLFLLKEGPRLRGELAEFVSLVQGP